VIVFVDTLVAAAVPGQQWSRRRVLRLYLPIVAALLASVARPIRRASVAIELLAAGGVLLIATMRSTGQDAEAWAYCL